MVDNGINDIEPDDNEGQAHDQTAPAAPAAGDLTTTPAEADPPPLSVADFRRLLDRVDALEREKAAAERAAAAAAGEPVVHPDTHVLVLANGDTVNTANASVTHVALDDDTVVPVIARHELNPAL